MIDRCLEVIAEGVYRCRNTGKLVRSSLPTVRCCSARPASAAAAPVVGRTRVTCDQQELHSLCSGCVWLLDSHCTRIKGCDAERLRGIYASRGHCPFKRLKMYTEPIIEPDVFVTLERLAALSRDMALYVAKEGFDAVIGIARSGLIPASIVAVMNHLPLWMVSPYSRTFGPASSGFRLADPGTEKPKRPILIDDTTSSGNSLRIAQAVLKDRGVDVAARAVVLCSPSTRDKVDFCCAIYEKPHYLEWCFANTFWAAEMAYDMDGIICADDAPDIITAAPLYLPKVNPAVIISARPDTVREITMQWLRRHGVRVAELVMWPGPRLENDKAKIAVWKAEQLKARRPIRIYAESDPEIARMVAEMANIPVLCPKAEKVFNQNAHRWKL